MEQLEMIKAFALLDRVATWDTRHKGEKYLTTITGHKYNPITDLSLSFKAMIDYQVMLEFHNGFGYASMEGDVGISSFESKEQAPIAILECILKSKGLHND